MVMPTNIVKNKNNYILYMITFVDTRRKIVLLSNKNSEDGESDLQKNKLYVLREKSGFTKTDVAIFLGMTTSGITGIERSKKISLDKAMKLSKIYNVSIDVIFHASKELIEV